MKRREALKNIGLTIGYSAIAPSVFSILQSCTTEKEKWVPLFFTEEESIVITKLVDLILPKTETTPGALDVNVPEFIDLYASKAYTEEDKAEYKEGIKSIVKALPVKETGAKDLKTEDYNVFLDKYLKPSKEEKVLFRQEKNLVYKSILNLRNQAVWAYRTSKTIGEEILVYEPIPAVQKGCITVEEATGGKAWSL
ncbi:gluconate 2-dehydrogenase subunit 3 family protein [Seonamhaeicola sediminis]|uniref:Gluconate 2-dehydrogenase subunit 3 family protein n=1 Tax=Seonamhaeicola sediminis TaxID=2528206 RepID=A0A562YG74_9FLAO|nr:gluconate 2-dehydrogenase subunit 3 family protein [Seonamhaeicola sediminis]TWO33361.1 gluconate 2-dehydrogenase subunit 3 family protein [Seonamhaeicola sediminis]